MIDFSRPALGYVWIGMLRRPYYSIREIRHGHNKGKFLVEYRQTATRFRKTITTKDMIRRYDDEGEKSMWQR